jgi:uncharacterized protein YbjT (DUF2867 family)
LVDLPYASPLAEQRVRAQPLLDLAEAACVRHVTYLSAYGIRPGPPQAVELDLIGRGVIPHSILRPAWFMQNFSESFLKPVDGVITVPTADGSEAFIDAEDIAAVAAETLASPDHAGAAYALSGPKGSTVSQAAEVIAGVTGKPVKHNDVAGLSTVECPRGELHFQPGTGRPEGATWD